jgi:CheY-like chemotaxis protein
MAGKKLLVADDSLTIQKVIRLALSNEGYEIQATSDGADVIQQIATFRPDVVLIDVSLPTKSAFQIKREANTLEDHQGIKYILMSSAFEKIDEEQAREVQFHGRLTKPFDPPQLKQVLNEVLLVPAPPKFFPKASAPAQMPPLPHSPQSDQLLIDEPKIDEPKIDEDDELWGQYEKPTSERDEIKHLTESTIRMTELSNVADLKSPDEFEWEINEPQLKPHGSYQDHNTIALNDETPFSIDLELSQTEESAKISLQPEPASTSVAPQQIEALVKKQVEMTIQKMAAELFPEVAERVIKAEIHKLLTEKF